MKTNRSNPDLTVCFLKGSVSGKYMSSVGKEIKQVMSDPEGTKIALDMSGVTYIDSSGMGHIIHLREFASEHGKEQILVIPDDNLRNLFLTCCFDSHMRVVESLESLNNE